ncbi:ABC transporter permease [bacterium]|nr:ABC transporter permease [bacterium]
MNLTRIAAVARKEAIHVLRDPRSLGITFAIPVMLMLLYGFALSLDVDDLPLIVYDQNATPASRDLISHFTGSEYFTLVGNAAAYRDVQKAIDAGDAMVGLVIPFNFEQLVQAGRPAPVQVLIDGSDANKAITARGYAQAAAAAYANRTLVNEMLRGGMRAPDPPVEARPRVWFNEDMESRNFIIPGLIALIMTVVGALLTSLTVAREWEQGTMEQLIATPVKRAEFVLGKLAPYFVVGFCDLLLCIILGRYVFDVPLRGSVLLLVAVSLVFLVGAMSLGMLISIATKNVQLAVQTAMMATYLPAMILSGFFVAIPNMPGAIQLVTHIVPARYFVTLLKGIYLKGLGLRVMWFDALLLVVFAVIVLGLAIRKFRKKLV